ANVPAHLDRQHPRPQLHAPLDADQHPARQAPHPARSQVRTTRPAARRRLLLPREPAHREHRPRCSTMALPDRPGADLERPQDALDGPDQPDPSRKGPPEREAAAARSATSSEARASIAFHPGSDADRRCAMTKAIIYVRSATQNPAGLRRQETACRAYLRERDLVDAGTLDRKSVV